jgi:spermidine/putrescine transport system substrate-binding protein
MSGNSMKRLFGTASRRTCLSGVGAAAVGLTFTGGKFGKAFAAEEKKLHFYNWDTCIGEDTLDNYKEASGINVNMSLFATNDKLFANRAGQRVR